MNGEPSRPVGRGLARYLRYVGAVLALAVLAFVIVTAKPAEVWEALKGVDAATVAVVLALNLVLIALFTARSQLLLRHMGHIVPLPVLVPATVLGNVAGAITPGGSGEILRALALQRSAGLRLADAATLVVYERVLSTYLLLVSTLACLALTNLDAMAAAAMVALCCLLVLLPWLCARVLLPRLPAAEAINGAGFLRQVLRYGLRLAFEIRILLTSAPLLVAWSSLTLASFAVVAFQFDLLARSIDVEISIFDGWIAFGGSVFATIASFLPLGIGVGDGSIAAILNQTGVPFNQATAIALLVRALTTLPLILLAVVSYFALLRFRAQSANASVQESLDA